MLIKLAFIQFLDKIPRASANKISKKKISVIPWPGQKVFVYRAPPVICKPRPMINPRTNPEPNPAPVIKK